MIKRTKEEKRKEKKGYIDVGIIIETKAVDENLKHTHFVGNHYLHR